MQASRKKAFTYLLFWMAVIVAFGCTLSYFTDRIETHATVKTSGFDKGAVNIQPTPNPSIEPDNPELPPFEDPTPDDPTDDLGNWWAWLNSRALGNFNPGDKLTLSFDMVNAGELATDIRETFVITSSEPLSEAPEFRLFSQISEDKNGSNRGEEVVLEEQRIDDTHYIYTIAPYTLSSPDQVLPEHPGMVAQKEYYLVFDGKAANAFQGAQCTVDYVAEAKQHANGNVNDWSTIAEEQLIIGGQTLNVVPSAQ